MRYKATVAYDGSGYHGWQSQTDKDTVQDTIMTALRKIHKHEMKIVASGRTDRNVHALGQVFHFDSDLKISEENWVKALNARLPRDIRIQSVKSVNNSFHARYDVVSKRYDYFINMGVYNLFARQTITQLNQQLDVAAMRQASALFIGEHDFTSFNSNSLAETPDQVRTIYDMAITEEDGIVCLSFIGSGFMRYMVRMLVGTLIEVGKGHLNADDVRRMRDARSKTVCRFNAPPEGLYLVEVRYKNHDEKPY